MGSGSCLDERRKRSRPAHPAIPLRGGMSDEQEVDVASSSFLELELIQTHMAQKPLLWVEVGAHAVRNRYENYRNPDHIY